MVFPRLDAASFSSSLANSLYRGGVLPVSVKSRQALKAAARGEATSGMMESIIRGMKSAHGKRNLARDNGGAQFVGPTTRTPAYKTGKGVRRLLREASGSAVLTDVKSVEVLINAYPRNVHAFFFFCTRQLYVRRSSYSKQ